MKRMWPLIFLGAGLAVSIYGIGLVLDARHCRAWPTTDGRVVRSEAQIVGREKNQRLYAPDVAYTYQVGHQTFEGNRVTLAPRNYSQESSVRAVLARFPAGGTVKVFYDPERPASSILDRATTGAEWAYPIGGVILVVLGVYLWLQR